MDLVAATWNIMGANSTAKRQALQLFFKDLNCNIVCLQETKIEGISSALVTEILGPRFGRSFLCLPAVGTCGGVLIAVSDDFDLVLESAVPSRFSVTGHVTHRADLTTWMLTAVYGPQEDAAKSEFLQEIRLIKNVVQNKWMVLGDFNLISSAEDKNNGNINLRMMGQFRALIGCRGVDICLKIGGIGYKHAH